MRYWVVLVMLISLSGVAVMRAEDNASTTKPAAVAPMALWLAQLADTDEVVREEARVTLMGLTREQLPELRGLIERSLPLAPSQTAVLKEIVVQVYLAGETYEAMAEQGFIGIKPAIDNGENDLEGVVVGELLPGFCGYRALQIGDVIVGVAEYDGMPVRNTDQLSALIDRDAGKTVHLNILRRGQLVSVALKLDHRPVATTRGNPLGQELLNERSVKAEVYWQQTFAPLLLEGGVSSRFVRQADNFG